MFIRIRAIFCQKCRLVRRCYKSSYLRTSRVKKLSGECTAHGMSPRIEMTGYSKRDFHRPHLHRPHQVICWADRNFCECSAWLAHYFFCTTCLFSLQNAPLKKWSLLAWHCMMILSILNKRKKKFRRMDIFSLLEFSNFFLITSHLKRMTDIMILFHKKYYTQSVTVLQEWYLWE